jgi:hypothetical protein
MPEDTPQKPKPISERGRVAQAYARLFGRSDDHRNEDQRVVWQDMQRRGYADRPVLVADGEGHVCQLRLAAAGGAQAFHCDTKLLVHEGHSSDPEAKPKGKGKSIR